MDTSEILDMRNKITPEDLEAIVRNNVFPSDEERLVV